MTHVPAAAAHLFAENANKSTEQFAENANCPDLKGQIMTDTVLRQGVIDAVRSVRPGTTCRGDAIIAAINAIPAVGALYPINGMPKSGKRVYGDRTQPKTRIVAALGE